MNSKANVGAIPPLSHRQRDWIAGALLLLVTLVVYLPALRGGFLIDDNLHLTAPHLRSWAGLWRIWSEPGVTQQYYPLLHTAFWLEHRLWGDAVVGYHLVNVLEHVAVAGLIVVLMRKLALPGAWLAGFAFALHPVCVESVAWMAEQKNTLSAVFYLAAACVYLDFERERRWTAYAVATALFGAALLSKTATVALPAVLLVLTWWRRGRVEWRRDLAPLLPWLAAGAALGQVTAWIEHHLITSVGVEFSPTWLERCWSAGRALGFYLGKVIWPVDLAFFYPAWPLRPAPLWSYAVSIVALVGLVALYRRGNRGVVAALLIFVGTLFPVLGFFDLYWFIFSPVADHLQYLAMPALVILLATGGARFMAKFPPAASYAAAALLVALLGATSLQQSRFYRDGETLYREALKRNPEAWIAHQNLGVILLGKPDGARQAAECLETVLRLKPRINLAGVHSNLAVALAGIPERKDEVVLHLEEAVRLRPNLAEAHNNLACALADLPGRLGEAQAHCEEAVRLEPDYIDARLSLASFLASQRRFADAHRHLEAALRIDPHCEPAQQFLAELAKVEAK